MKIKFNLNSFEPVPAGIRRMEITEAKAIPSGKPSKIEITFKDMETSRIIKNNYNLTIPGGLNAFGFLCRTAFNLADMDEFDTDNVKDFVGRRLLCEVVHTKGTEPRDDGSYTIFANIKKVSTIPDDVQEELNPRELIAKNTEMDDDLD